MEVAEGGSRKCDVSTMGGTTSDHRLSQAALPLDSACHLPANGLQLQLSYLQNCQKQGRDHLPWSESSHISTEVRVGDKKI